jgi:hypothetical protein
MHSKHDLDVCIQYDSTPLIAHRIAYHWHLPNDSGHMATTNNITSPDDDKQCCVRRRTHLMLHWMTQSQPPDWWMTELGFAGFIFFINIFHLNFTPVYIMPFQNFK